MRDLFMALNQCLLQAPPGVADSEITIVFSLKRDGSPLGKAPDLPRQAVG
jgi:hypothetical protein